MSFAAFDTHLTHQHRSDERLAGKMKVGLFLHRYFPFGGQQRDFLGVAKALIAEGHTPEVFVMDKTEPIPLPDDVPIHCIRCNAMTNAGQAKQFSVKASSLADQLGVNVRLGFVKMQKLDFYFCADPCLRAKVPSWKACLPRYRTYLQLEAETFRKESKTRYFALADEQVEAYANCYGVDWHRFEVLLPNLHPSLQNGSSEREPGLRVLFVGSDFRRKGLDRLLAACAKIDGRQGDVQLEIIIVGKGEVPSDLCQACEKNGWMVRAVGPQLDVRSFYATSSVLIHPARSEPVVWVVREALPQGLPVIATDVCGYARVVREGNAGWVLSETSIEESLPKILQEILSSPATLTQKGAKALSYVHAKDFFSSHYHIAKTLLQGVVA